mmetsp:Transcript_28907/g.69486  ORF Transcript_28907/g.69486 Transcript_28907/m.69486 type:complete len:300 (-) Transcript_28907:93-992(-)
MRVLLIAILCVEVCSWSLSSAFLSRKPLRGLNTQPQVEEVTHSVTEEAPVDDRLARDLRGLATQLHTIARNKVDSNQDGHLDLDELRNFARYLREKERDVNTRDEMARWDANNDGKVMKEELYGDLAMLNNNDVIATALKLMDEKFAVSDKNQDGMLGKEELMIFLHPELDQAAIDLEAQQQFNQLNRNGDAGVDFNEYQAEFGTTVGSDSIDTLRFSQDLKEFKLHDHDNNGLLSVEEMRELVHGDKYLHSTLDDLFTLADHDKDGLISLAEFEKQDHSRLIESEVLEDWLYHSHDEL